MDWIKEYLVQLIAAALIAGIVTNLIGKKTAVGKSIQLICGIFLIFVLIMPWTKVEMSDFADYLDNLSIHANAAVQTGENMAYDEISQIIKAKTEAYILDKANSFGAELAVEVRVDSSELPVPVAVKLTGSISPYGRKKLENIIAEDIGIPLEEQTWTG